MLEYIVIFVIVGIAGLFTLRRLVKDASGSHRESCACECNTQSKVREIADLADKTSKKHVIGKS